MVDGAVLAVARHDARAARAAERQDVRQVGVRRRDGIHQGARDAGEVVHGHHERVQLEQHLDGLEVGTGNGGKEGRTREGGGQAVVRWPMAVEGKYAQRRESKRRDWSMKACFVCHTTTATSTTTATTTTTGTTHQQNRRAIPTHHTLKATAPPPSPE
jgi:hypothetical protein